MSKRKVDQKMPIDKYQGVQVCSVVIFDALARHWTALQHTNMLSRDVRKHGLSEYFLCYYFTWHRYIYSNSSSFKIHQLNRDVWNRKMYPIIQQLNNIVSIIVCSLVMDYIFQHIILRFCISLCSAGNQVIEAVESKETAFIRLIFAWLYPWLDGV